MEKKNGVRIQSVDRILDILEELSRSKHGITISDLARNLNLQVSTTYNLVNTLRTRDYVYQDPESKKYYIGPKVLALKNFYSDNLDIRDKVVPFIERLHREIPETVHLSIKSGTSVVPVYRLESTHTIKVDSAYVGNRGPIYCTATGRALLCGYKDEELRNLLSTLELKPYTEHTITDKDALIEEIKKSKERGYTLDNMEFQPNVHCIGAPLLNHEGEVVAAISVSTPSFRFTPEEKERIKSLVVQYAREISDELGYKYYSPDK